MNLRSSVFLRLTSFLCIGLLILTGCASENDNENPEPMPALTVEVSVPEVSEWPIEVEANGRVEAWQESIISSEVSGARLTELFVEVGEEVVQGQLLAQLKTDSLEIARQQAEAEVAGAEASYRLAKARAERSRKLKRTGALSDDEVLQAVSQSELAEAELKAARARLASDELNLKHSAIRAPDSGVISSQTATVGSVVSAGSEIFRLIRKSRFEWRAQVPSARLSELAVGQPVQVTLESGDVLEGAVRKIAPSVDHNTLTATVYVDLPSTASLKAGMTASGVIYAGSEMALHVPESALVYRDGYTYVVEVEDDKHVRLMKVQVGRRREGRVEVKGSLGESEQLVVSGGQFLYEGDLVEVSNAPVFLSGN